MASLQYWTILKTQRGALDRHLSLSARRAQNHLLAERRFSGSVAAEKCLEPASVVVVATQPGRRCHLPTWRLP